MNDEPISGYKISNVIAQICQVARHGKKLSSASSFPSENTFWAEWNQFLKVPIVQSDIFSFAKLIDEHEH